MRTASLIFFLGYCVIAANSWWLLSELEPERFVTQPLLCSQVPGLTSRQRVLCMRHPTTIKYFVEGLRTALEHCQKAFVNQVWNCTFALRGVGSSPLRMSSKETAFVYAISSAGVSHAMARACAKGHISECGCGSTPMTPGHDFIWAGCSDNVRYANQFARKFIDGTDRKGHKDARALMNKHNNRAARRLLTSHMRSQCKCHGVSGSCVTKTCWKVVPSFDEFTTLLREKYQMAQQVTATPHETDLMIWEPPVEGGRTERYLRDHSSKKASRGSLVYLESSPDYCLTSQAGRGQFDTTDRECGDNCSQICCGRGWRTVRDIVDEPCNCVFVWCCEVKCKTCKKIVDRNYCR